MNYSFKIWSHGPAVTVAGSSCRWCRFDQHLYKMSIVIMNFCLNHQAKCCFQCHNILWTRPILAPRNKNKQIKLVMSVLFLSRLRNVLMSSRGLVCNVTDSHILHSLIWRPFCSSSSSRLSALWSDGWDSRGSSLKANGCDKSRRLFLHMLQLCIVQRVLCPRLLERIWVL